MQDTDWFEIGVNAPPDVTLRASPEAVSNVAHLTLFDSSSHDAHASGTHVASFDASTDDIFMSFNEAVPGDVSGTHNEVFSLVITADDDSHNSIFERKEGAYETMLQEAEHHQSELFDVSQSVADFSVTVDNVDIPVPVFGSHASLSGEGPASRAGSEYYIPVDGPVCNDSDRVDLLVDVKKADFEHHFSVDVPVCTFNDLVGQHVEFPLNRAFLDNCIPVDAPACTDSQDVDLLVDVNMANFEYHLPMESPVCTLHNIDGQLGELPLSRNDLEYSVPVSVPDSRLVDLLSNVNTADSEYKLPIDSPVMSNFDWHQVELPVNQHCSESMFPNGDDDIVLIFDDLEQVSRDKSVAHVAGIDLLSSPTSGSLLDPLREGMLNSSAMNRVSDRSPVFSGQQTTRCDSEQLMFPVLGHSEQVFVPEQDSKLQLLLPVQHTADKLSLLPAQNGAEQLYSSGENQSELLSFSDIAKEEYFSDQTKLPTQNEDDTAGEFDFDLPRFVPVIRAQNMDANQGVVGNVHREQPVVLDVASLSMDFTIGEEFSRDTNFDKVNNHASNEWGQIQCIEPVFVDPDHENLVSDVLKTVSTEDVSYTEVLQQLDRSAVIQQYSRVIRTSIDRRGFAGFLHRLCGGPHLNRRLHDERNFTFCLAALPFSDEDTVHLRVLQTIYKKLTGNVVDCPRYGSHWEQIGFQGQNPATDLRGTGFLSLLQLLHFITEPRSRALAIDAYKLSLNQTQSFPFAVMGINLTKIALSALREDCLNKECNRRGSVLSVLNDFFHGSFQQLYTTWRYQHKTIADSGFVLAELESYVKQHVSRVIESTTANVKPSTTKSKNVDFSNFVEITDEETMRKSIDK